MRVVVSGAMLGLAWFAAVSMLATALAWVVARLMVRQPSFHRLIDPLYVRLFPAAAATLFTAGLFLPAHIRLEPTESDESFGVAVLGLAAIGLALAVRSVYRAVRVSGAARQTGRLLRAGARAVASAYEVRDVWGVSLAGVLRPRILVGSETRQALTAEELEVAIAHEHAHRRSGDNLKRCLIYCAPDLFGWTDAGRDLEARWRAEAELAADARAVAGDERRAVHLASALLKVAGLRAAHDRAAASPVWSTLHEPELLEIRVRRLLTGDARKGSAFFRAASALAAGVWLALLIVMAAAVEPQVHGVTEALIRFLP